jgi:hypothetical protein
MNDVQHEDRLRISMPVPFLVRGFFVAIALFCIVLPAWDLHRGVWPFNWASPFFLLIILGAWSIGISAAVAGITGWAEAWTVRQGRIHVVRRNPFGFRRYSFGPNDLAPFEVCERQAMEGDNTWVVVLVTASGKRFQTHDFQTRAAAEQMRTRILHIFER